MPKKFGHMEIEARRWFNRSQGNTYHSVAIWVDGKLIGVEPQRYGYDRAYMQTAHKMLQEAGYFPKTNEQLQSGMDKDYYDFMNYIADNHDKVRETVMDVTRRGDLHSPMDEPPKVSYKVGGAKAGGKGKGRGKTNTSLGGLR